jgi:hypothetical protein
MKLLKTTALGVLLSLSFTFAHAQLNPAVKEAEEHKPRIFSDLPPKISFNIHMLEAVLATEVGTRINLLIAPGFSFQGHVVSKSDASEKRVNTIVIRSTNRSGATLTFTRITNTDGSYSYNGRILSMKHSDALEIVPEKGGFALVKKEFNELLME